MWIMEWQCEKKYISYYFYNICEAKLKCAVHDGKISDCCTVHIFINDSWGGLRDGLPKKFYRQYFKGESTALQNFHKIHILVCYKHLFEKSKQMGKVQAISLIKLFKIFSKLSKISNIFDNLCTIFLIFWTNRS